MGANVINLEILAIAKDPSDDRVLIVLLNLDLTAGYVAKVRDVVDDLANNRVEVHYLIKVKEDEPDHHSNMLALVRTQNPYTMFDASHKTYVYAHEASQSDVDDDMNTSSAHRN